MYAAQTDRQHGQNSLDLQHHLNLPRRHEHRDGLQRRLLALPEEIPCGLGGAIGHAQKGCGEGVCGGGDVFAEVSVTWGAYGGEDFV
jgi:hypothetical protein